MGNLQSERKKYSYERLEQFKSKLKDITELSHIPNLTIFAAGSYARLEASEHSDLDLFFICEKSDDIKKTNILQIKVFSKIIEIANEMKLPQFSKDGEYLNIMCHDKMCEHLGSPEDDYENLFTARMLLFLESECLYGENTYNKIIEDLVNNYFKDYSDHPNSFDPTFLLNDIQRYWKTILLNYENKRKNGASDIERKQAKVKNFKLKYSRMITCFSLIATLGVLVVPVTPEKVIELIKLTPCDRLTWITVNNPQLSELIAKIQDEYSWFLSLTGLPTAEIQSKFSDEESCKLFERANTFGDLMFNLLVEIEEIGSSKSDSISKQFLRKLVI